MQQLFKTFNTLVLIICLLACLLLPLLLFRFLVDALEDVPPAVLSHSREAVLCGLELLHELVVLRSLLLQGPLDVERLPVDRGA